MRILELQTAAYMATFNSPENDLFAAHPIEDLLLDPEAQVFYRACALVKDANAVAISAEMTKQIPHATPEYVRDRLLPLGFDFGEVNIEYNITQLREAKAEKVTDDTLLSIIKRRKSGRMTREDVKAEVLDAIKEFNALDERGSLTLSDGERAAAIFKANGDLYASGEMPTFPDQFPRLKEKIPFIRTGNIMGVIGPSGIGKSMFGLQLADNWADWHGRKVLYAVAEMNASTFVARYVNQKTGLPVDEIEMGIHNEAVVQLLQPFKSGGSIHFWECAGKRMGAIIAKAEEEGADLIVDTFHKVSVDEYNEDSKTDRIAHANQDLASFAQRRNKLVVSILQMDKASTLDGGDPSVEKTKDSIDHYQSVRYALAFKFTTAYSNREVPHPIPGRKPVREYAGKPAVEGDLVIDKNSFGGWAGWPDPVFRDGDRSRLFEDTRRK